ncbi:MAG: hypothetical protein ABI321_06435 [Polyangia bacterium]
MLDPWIIEEIRRREEAERESIERGRPVLEIPFDMPMYRPSVAPEPPAEDRGVIVIDY